MKHLIPSHRVPARPRLFWIHLIVALSAALLFWAGNGTLAETSYAPTSAATVWDLAEPDDLVATSQGDDTTAFREEEAGFSAHYRVPDHLQGDGPDDLRPRLNITAITEALLEAPDDKSSANRKAPGRHVDSGGNFGIVELPMAAATTRVSMAPPRWITVYYDDRGWVVAYLPADEPAAGIWKYDPQETGNTPGETANDLEQNLLLLAINEVLAVAKKNAPEIVPADDDTVGYYHWQHPEHNAFVLFSHESDGGASDPVRFVVPPTIENIPASASVLITSISTDDQPTVTAELMVDDNAVVTAQQPARLAVSGFTLQRTDDASRLYEVTVAVDDGATAAGAVMLVYTKPSS